MNGVTKIVCKVLHNYIHYIFLDYIVCMCLRFSVDYELLQLWVGGFDGREALLIAMIMHFRSWTFAAGHE